MVLIKEIPRLGDNFFASRSLLPVGPHCLDSVLDTSRGVPASQARVLFRPALSVPRSLIATLIASWARGPPSTRPSFQHYKVCYFAHCQISFGRRLKSRSSIPSPLQYLQQTRGEEGCDRVTKPLNIASFRNVTRLVGRVQQRRDAPQNQMAIELRFGLHRPVL